MIAARVWAPILLAAVAGGCAQPGRPVPEAALAGRILPPPGTGDPGTPAPAAEREPLPPPRPVEPTPGDEGLVAVAGPGVPAPAPESTPPITLEQAIALAFQNQPRLRVFEEGVEQARGRGQAAFAPFLPQLKAVNQAFTGRNPRGPLDASGLPAPEFPTIRGPQDFVYLELLLQWTLWDFGRTVGRSQQAELGVAIAQLRATRAEQTVAFEVASAYFRVLQARAIRRVADESVRRAESVLDIARKSLRAGLVDRDRVLRAEVELAREQRGVVTARRAELVAVAALNLAIGLNVSAPTEVVDRTDEPPFELPLEECLRQAVENRREFQVARRAIEVSQEGVRVARADFAPRVFLQGAAAVADGHRVLVGATETASINIHWSLGEGGARLGELRTADAGLRAAAAQAEVVCDTIAFEVHEAYRDLEAARRGIALARPAVTQAREYLRLVTRKYEAGDATPTDVIDAETALTRAQQDYYNSLYDYHTALARLAFATGVGPSSGSAPCK